VRERERAIDSLFCSLFLFFSLQQCATKMEKKITKKQRETSRERAHAQNAKEKKRKKEKEKKNSLLSSHQASLFLFIS
jgi:uncharacterized protein YdaU (DUF1376 family)